MNPKTIAQFILLTLIISACGGSKTPAVTDTPIPAETLAVPATLPATPTVPLAILVLPADMDIETSDLYQTSVYDLAQSAGMRFQVRNTLTPADLEPGLQVVIVVPPDTGHCRAGRRRPKCAISGHQCS